MAKYSIWQKCLYLFLSASCSILIAQASVNTQEAQNLQTGSPAPNNLPANSEQRQVYIGFYLTGFALNQSNETFQIAGRAFSSWQDKSLAFTANNPNEVRIINAPNGIWLPNIEIINAKETEEGRNDLFYISPSGIVTRERKIYVTLASGLDLRAFPFDSQKLKIISESYQWDISQLILVPDLQKTGIDANSYSTSAEWHIKGIKPVSEIRESTPRNKKYSRLTFEIEIERRYGYYIWKIFVPLLLVMGISWAVFWIKITEVGPQASMAVTSLLSVIAFSFTTTNSLPKVAYLMLSDSFIFLCYLLTFMTVFEIITIHYLITRGKEKIAVKIRSYSRWVIPLFFFLANVIFGLFILM